MVMSMLLDLIFISKETALLQETSQLIRSISDDCINTFKLSILIYRKSDKESVFVLLL